MEDIARLKLAKNAKYTSPAAREAFLEAMYSVVSKETKKIVAHSTFNAVLVDESTDVSNVAQMVVHLRCVSSGQVTLRFGGIASLARKDANSIRAALERKAKDFDLDWQKSHLGSDGASTFTGRHNGVMAQMITAHNMAHSMTVHCVCHREALACADAVKAVTYLQHKVSLHLCQG